MAKEEISFHIYTVALAAAIVSLGLFSISAESGHGLTGSAVLWEDAPAKEDAKQHESYLIEISRSFQKSTSAILSITAALGLIISAVLAFRLIQVNRILRINP